MDFRASNLSQLCTDAVNSMRILIYSHVFHPSIGGMERVSELLAEQLAFSGNHVDVVTHTPTADPTWDQEQPYRIWRRPSIVRLLHLLLISNVVHSSGASLALSLPAVLLSRPLLITHHGYQTVSVDGLGWGSEGATPLETNASLAFYRSRLKALPWLRQVILLHLRRWVAYRAASNVAVTNWVAKRQPLPRQQVIMNPVQLPFRSSQARETVQKYAMNPNRSNTLLFLGRLVQEKGLDVLLRALSHLSLRYQLYPSLLVVGEGPMRSKWQTLAQKLQLDNQIKFLGALRGQSLLDVFDQAAIGVVPSVWEEPMGLVAIEHLAAGLIPVVSAQGGLHECVGDLGVVVPNGDFKALAEALALLIHEPQAFNKNRVSEHLENFKPDKVAALYHALYQQISGPNNHASRNQFTRGQSIFIDN
jgi:glycosyltransferase involved in cell wall biosynthesis